MPPINEPLYSPPVPLPEKGLRRETGPLKKMKKTSYHAEVEKQENLDILYLMLAFRFINALLVQTFFQPDEYFQSLEPAWQIAFGADSGAWITWVSILPLIMRILTNMKSGMGASAEIIDASSTVRRSLLCRQPPHEVIVNVPSVQSYDRRPRTKAPSSTDCRTGRLLHLEAGR